MDSEHFNFYAQKQGDSGLRWSLRYFVCDLHTWKICYWVDANHSRGKDKIPPKGEFFAVGIRLLRRENNGKGVLEINCSSGKKHRLKEFKRQDAERLLHLFRGQGVSSNMPTASDTDSAGPTASASPTSQMGFKLEQGSGELQHQLQHQKLHNQPDIQTTTNQQQEGSLLLLGPVGVSPSLLPNTPSGLQEPVWPQGSDRAADANVVEFCPWDHADNDNLSDDNDKDGASGNEDD